MPYIPAKYEEQIGAEIETEAEVQVKMEGEVPE